MSTDWSHSGDEHAAAYNRAGLPHWAAQCLSEPSSPSEAASRPIEPASQPAGPASQAALAPVLADQPSAVVQATISDVLLTLPHDQDIGRAERYVELWSKAFGQVESQKMLHALLLPRRSQYKLQNNSALPQYHVAAPPLFYIAAPPAYAWQMACILAIDTITCTTFGTLCMLVHSRCVNQ